MKKKHLHEWNLFYLYYIFKQHHMYTQNICFRQFIENTTFQCKSINIITLITCYHKSDNNHYICGDDVDLWWYATSPAALSTNENSNENQQNNNAGKDVDDDARTHSSLLKNKLVKQHKTTTLLTKCTPNCMKCLHLKIKSDKLSPVCLYTLISRI